MDADGSQQVVSWTRGRSDDAFLVLDRNQNGTIDDARELFSHVAPQPISSEPNGFLALQLLDDNGDGWIDARDGRYEDLMLWTDRNHNGRSEADELTAVTSSGISRLGTAFSVSRRRDRHGNLFRYRGRIVGATVGPWMFDVILREAPPLLVTP